MLQDETLNRFEQRLRWPRRGEAKGRVTRQLNEPRELTQVSDWGE